MSKKKQYYNPNAELTLKRAILKTQYRLDELKLRQTIADIDRRLKALDTTRREYPPQGALEVPLALDISPASS